MDSHENKLYEHLDTRVTHLDNRVTELSAHTSAIMAAQHEQGKLLQNISDKVNRPTGWVGLVGALVATITMIVGGLYLVLDPIMEDIDRLQDKDNMHTEELLQLHEESIEHKIRLELHSERERDGQT